MMKEDLLDISINFRGDEAVIFLVSSARNHAYHSFSSESPIHVNPFTIKPQLHAIFLYHCTRQGGAYRSMGPQWCLYRR